jgi:hypothetical protein
MKKRHDTAKIQLKKLLALLAAIAISITACTAAPKQTGTLKGHVTIGPLSPVSREGVPDPTPAPEVYTAREIVIYGQNGRTEVTRAQIGASGAYQVTLPVGTYVVDINHAGIDRGIGLPQQIEILNQQVTVLDVEIDTGIR